MKGFMAILEAFLAIVIIYIVLSQLQINLPAAYSDTANIERLHRYAHDMAFSICGNMRERQAMMMLDNSSWTNLRTYLPADIDFHADIYKNLSNDHLLDDWAGGIGNIPNSSVATSSCIIAGGPFATNYSVTTCTYGGSCLGAISAGDGNVLNVLQNTGFTVTFTAPRGRFVDLIVQGNHNTSGYTWLYNSSGSQIDGSHSFPVLLSGYENYTFDLSSYMPDSMGIYNVTIKPAVNASYDSVFLSVSQDSYSPRRVVVQVWNRGG